jgi:putative sterol carrier protein
MPTLTELTAKISAAVGGDSGLGKTLKLNLKSDGVVYIDRAAVSNDDKPADLTITISLDNLLALADGRLQPAFAIMMGKMTCSDMGLLMELEDPLTALIARFA